MTRTNVYDERRGLYKKIIKKKKKRKNKRGKERRVERSDEKFAGSRVQWRPWAVRGEICQREILCCSCTSTTHECTARWNRPNEERKALGVGSDVVERWLRKTRGLIIFEDPLVSALSPILVYILNHPLAFSPYVHSILQE